MASVLENEDVWGARIAGRLRVVFATCADLAPEERARYLEEELEYACEELQSLSPERKRNYLERVRERFPLWSGAGESAPAPQVSRPIPSAAAEAAGPANLEDPSARAEAAVRELVSVAGDLREKERERLGQRLYEAGIAGSWEAKQSKRVAIDESDEWVDLVALPESEMESDQVAKMAETLRDDLEMESNPVSLLRVLKLLRRSVLTIRELDQLAREAWRQISPDEALPARRTGAIPDLQTVLAGYLDGQGKIDSEAMLDSLNFTKRLLAAYIFAIGEGGDRFIRKFHNRFHPEMVRDYVRQDSTKRGLKKEEVLCWNRYEQLMDRNTAAMLERDLRLEIKESVAHALRG